MKNIVKNGYILLSLFYLVYLSFPNPQFPDPPADSLQSQEPADTETETRRAYFTNYSREEVLVHYKNQLQETSVWNIKIPTYRLNYPPEEAQTLIRDQTRSTYLEEIVHPFRESLFINGFEPKVEKDTIFIDGRRWRQKIIVRYVQSNLMIRLILGILTLILIYIVSKYAYLETSTLIRVLRKKWI